MMADAIEDFRCTIIHWLQEMLDLDPSAIHTVCTGSFEAKIDVLRDHGMNFFIEDRLETCFLLDDAGFVPILYRQPWNRQGHPFVEVGSWQEIESLISY